MCEILTILSSLLLTVNSGLSCKIFKKVILGLTIARDVSLAKIAASMGKPLASSGIRYLERFLTRIRIDWHIIGEAVLAVLPESVKFIVSMDRTAWEMGGTAYNILTIGINFGGISLPVAAISIGRDGASNGAQMIEVTETLLSFMPAGRIELLCADREFCSIMYMRWLKYRGIPFCIRIQGRLWIRRKGKAERLDRYLSQLSVNKQMVLKKCQLSLGLPIFKVYIWAYRLRAASKDDNGLLILATPLEYTAANDAYRLRWAIETTFRCLKSGGFDLENTHITNPVRLMNLFKLVCVTFDWLSLTGASTLKRRPIRIQHSTGRLRETIFDRGLTLVDALLTGEVVNRWTADSTVKFGPDFVT